MFTGFVELPLGHEPIEEFKVFSRRNRIFTHNERVHRDGWCRYCAWHGAVCAPSHSAALGGLTCTVNWAAPRLFFGSESLMPKMSRPEPLEMNRAHGATLWPAFPSPLPMIASPLP